MEWSKCYSRVFTDLKKALDIMDHRILLARLEHYGVRGEALRFLVIYLRGRFQYVGYNGVCGVCVYVCGGVCGVCGEVGGWLSVGCRRGQS